MKIGLGLSKNAIPWFVGVGVCMYDVYICINFHDKIIVCAGSAVDLKGIKNKSKKRN